MVMFTMDSDGLNRGILQALTKGPELCLFGLGGDVCNLVGSGAESVAAVLCGGACG